MLAFRRRAVPLLAGALSLAATISSTGAAIARTTTQGDPDTAHRASSKQLIITVDRGTHQVHVQGLPNAQMRADGVSGGTGLGGATATARKKAKKGKKSKKANVKTTADPINLNDPALAPVVQDGGSAHLGERTLRQGMRGHDVRVLQSYLTVAGYPTSIDGQFGPGTKANVIRFEAAHSLTPENGVVTYSQSRVLRELVAKSVTGGAVGKATISADGAAIAPAGAPAAVRNMIAAANTIIDTPYVYGGGHGRWNDTGYDCSGAVSFALHGANLLSAPEDSTELESFGQPGPGKWVTVYADSGHAFIVIAGIAFDTAHYGSTTPAGSGPRWLSNPTGNLADGGNYVVRHPAGL